jgi:hypothetical protein
MPDSDGNASVPPKEFPLDTTSASMLPGRYATDYAVQWTEHEVIILFFEAKPVLIPFQSPEARAEFISAMNFTPAECIGRIIIVPDRAEGLIELIKSAVDNSRQLLAQRNAETQQPG